MPAQSKPDEDLNAVRATDLDLGATESAEAPGGVTLTGNVTATVTTEPDLTSTSNGSLRAGRLDETGYVRLRGMDADLDSEPAKNFIADCARNIEGLKSDRELREDWSLDEREWARLAGNMALLNCVKAEREKRIRDGHAAREAARQHFAQAPTVLSQIMHNELISPRHRIEAARELRHVAANGPEATGAAQKYVINIDLGGDDKLLIETEIVPKPPTTEEEEW